MNRDEKTMGHPAHIPKTMPGFSHGHPGKMPLKSQTKTEIIKRIPFFESLAESEIVNIEPYMREYKFKKNQYLFWEGDAARMLYVIRSGRVRILRITAAGKAMVLEVMSPGQICGGHALFSETHRNSAQAVDPTVAYGLSRDDYDLLVTKYPPIAKGIIKFLGQKLMDAHDVIISLVSSKVENRIASLIVRLCENHGTLTKDGIMINIRLTRQDIADVVGATVETTIRTISKFQKKGLLSTVSGRLYIKDLEAFKKMVQGGHQGKKD